MIDDKEVQVYKSDPLVGPIFNDIRDAYMRDMRRNYSGQTEQRLQQDASRHAAQQARYALRMMDG